MIWNKGDVLKISYFRSLNDSVLFEEKKKKIDFALNLCR